MGGVRMGGVRMGGGEVWEGVRYRRGEDGRG